MSFGGSGSGFGFLFSLGGFLGSVGLLVFSLVGLIVGGGLAGLVFGCFGIFSLARVGGLVGCGCTELGWVVVSLSSTLVSCSWFGWFGDVWSPSFLPVIVDVLLSLAIWVGLLPESEFFLSYSLKNADRELTFLFSPRFIWWMFGFKRVCLEGGQILYPPPHFCLYFYFLGTHPPQPQHLVVAVGWWRGWR